MVKIGETLKKLRQSRGLSLRRLAKELGTSHTVIALYEKDERIPTIDVVVRICDFFEIPLEYLILGEKSGGKYTDLELAELSSQADELEKEYRDMVKDYIKRVISHSNERKTLHRESKEDSISQKRKTGKKSDKN